MGKLIKYCKTILLSQLVNPKWLAGMIRYGYKGAGNTFHIMDVVAVVLGLDDTAEVMEGWLYENMANKYTLTHEIEKYMKSVISHTWQNILDKLLEAIARGMRKADFDMENRLKEEYLEIEGEIKVLL